MSLVHLFEKEISEIQNGRIREFVVDALHEYVDEELPNIKHFTDRISRSVELTLEFIQILHADDYASDILIAATLLQDITMYDEDGLENVYHPLTVRGHLHPLSPELGQEDFDNIMRLIESSHGFDSPIPQVMPSIDDSVYVWVLPFVRGLARKNR